MIACVGQARVAARKTSGSTELEVGAHLGHVVAGPLCLSPGAPG